MNVLFEWRKPWECLQANKPEDFITMLVKLQEECGVADLKMSDYGLQKKN